MELAIYNNMVHAIAECHRVDEVKDLRDKAIALELYYKQARNTENERRACEVRLRAERRTGELLKELARNQTSGLKQGPLSNDMTTEKSPYAEAIEQTGMSRQTAHRYEALVNVPQETFEQALRAPDKPTTSGILDKAKAQAVVQEARAPQPRMPDEVLWFWGRLRDFERDRIYDRDPAWMLEPMTETMRADVARIVPLVADFFARFQECLHESA